jgi:tetratricopeptide (TPR) repeat protein
MPKSADVMNGGAVAMAAHCRQLVRNAATPQRLRSNPLAKRILARATAEQDRSCSLKEAISRALSQLPLRERRIIERCDLDREIHALVAAELRISERHLYRERERIFKKLAALLTTPAAARMPAVVESSDSTQQLVKTSRALEENGACAVAADVLERRALECPDALERARLFLRLAELHARTGSSTRARECLEIAVRHAAHATNRSPLVDAELTLTRAQVLEDQGESEPLIVELSNRSVQLVRSIGSANYDQQAAAVLVRALALRALAANFIGDAEMAGRTVSEMHDALPGLHHGDADSHMAAFFSESLTKVLCENDLVASADCLAKALQVAQDAGLSVSSIALTVNLASLYRLRHDSARAVALLAPRLEMARVLGNRRVLAMLLIELASGYLDLRDYARAQQTLDDAVEFVNGNRAMQAPFLRVSAATSIRMKQFHHGLEASRAAEQAYSALGKSRLVGMSLRLEAEALHLTGDRRAALATIRQAIDALSEGSHRSSLAAAYTVLSKISGNLKHLDTARRLTKAT